MFYSWYRHPHDLIDGDLVRDFAFKLGMDLVYVSGALGILFKVASKSDPRGRLPNVNPDFYATLTGSADIVKVVEGLKTADPPLLGEDGCFMGWMQQLAVAAFDEKRQSGNSANAGEKPSMDTLRHYNPTGSEPAWMSDGWTAVWKAWEPKNGELTARGVWYRLVCPWIAENFGGDAARCHEFVGTTILPAVQKEVILSQLLQKARRRAPFALSNWLDGHRWQDSDYANETWEQTLKDAQAAAEKKCATGSSGRKGGRHRETATERDARLEKAGDDALAKHLQEMGIDPSQVGLGPEKVHAEVKDGDTLGPSPDDEKPLEPEVMPA